jgi:transitional endoplasmic reticulum ATPase
MPKLRKRAKTRPTPFLGNPSHLELTQLYLLRLLVNLGGHRRFIEQGFNQEISFSHENLASLIGIDEWLADKYSSTDNPDTVTKKGALNRIKSIHQSTELSAKKILPPKDLRNNCERLANIIGLSDAECKILAFAVYLKTSNIFEDASDLLEEFPTKLLPHVLSALLDIPIGLAQDSIKKQGKLISSGLISIESSPYRLSDKLNLLSDNFADYMMSVEDNPLYLLRDVILPTPPPTLSMEDFSHIDKLLKVLRPYLKTSIQTNRQGVNIFIYGSPGVGKTELARLLGQDCDAVLYEVSSEDAEGEAINTKERFRAFQASQSILRNQPALLLFDESEDVFESHDNPLMSLFGGHNQSQKTKGWINRALEQNPVPTIWLSNSRYCMDPAFIRRFDMVFELPIPSRQHRERILREQCDGVLGESSIVAMADSEQLAPAVVSRAVSVVKLVKDQLADHETTESIGHLINNTLKAQGHKAISSQQSAQLPDYYDPSFVNTNANLASLAQGIKAAGSGSLCLYGPSGTGKSAFVHWLSRYLELPLHIKKASDLLSMYVGEMEQNLAKAFHSAEQDQAILLLDEVDSFLQDRRGAKQSWEVTQVNELLTQMESYAGVFVATTNLVGNLDQAALRRFDMKLMFDYLKPEQAWELYRQHSKSLGLKCPGETQKRAITVIDILTPGDFALTTRKNRFEPIKSHADLISCLENECAMKEVGRKQAIGFA